MRESKLMQKIQIRASELGWRLFRNNVGFGWVGVACKTADPETVLLRRARRIRFGLAKGSSDLIGWKPLLVTKDMVGQTIAQFCAVEVKTLRGCATTEQINFILKVNDAGGDASIVSSPDVL